MVIYVLKINIFDPNSASYNMTLAKKAFSDKNLLIFLIELEHPLNTSNKRTDIALPIYFFK